jgi:predicted metal-dependent hydrolase
MEVHKVIYSGDTINFELHRKEVKNVNINVKPDMKVVVSAGDKVPLEFIIDFVKEKSPWILKQIEYFEKVQPGNVEDKEFVSGETFKYLGRQYRLKVIETDEIECVKLKIGYFHLYVKNRENQMRKQKLMDDWFHNKAEEQFNSSLKKMYDLVISHSVTKPQLSYKKMTARWGSCLAQKQVIILNTDLIKAPKHCIDYVVLHELIHFIHKNHDDKFYNLMTVLMPDWKSRKEILDQEVVREL